MNQKEIENMIKSLERSKRMADGYIKKNKLVQCKQCTALIKKIKGADDICESCLKVNKSFRELGL